MREQARRAIAECQTIAGFTEEPGRITRRFLTPPVHAVHAHLRTRMEALGMTVHTDAAGNLRGVHQPANASPKRLVIGSHIDTVPDAGAFDGVLGVVLGIELVEIAKERKLPLAIEVIAFSEEEGVRYGAPLLGSRAVAGIFASELLAYEDEDGIRMEEAIRAFGVDPSKINEAVLDENVRGFLEIHIEQGPVLESENLSVAAVSSIVGQTRLGLRFAGQANHAGTTPMHLRRDALAAAAEWINLVEKLASEADASRGQSPVATVGKISLKPNAGNVIPGVVDLSLDLRHSGDQARQWWINELMQHARACAQRRGVEVESTVKMSENAVEMDRHLTVTLQNAMESAGFPARTMTSGAGHDAMALAARVPTAMLFLRSPGGISHNPGESVREEDVEAALAVAANFLERIS